MSGLTFLKLGGSAITDKTSPFTARENVIRRIAREVKEARAVAGPSGLPLLLGHGSGSFGHYAAKESGFGEPGRWEAFAKTGAAAARLNRIVTDVFMDEGVPVVSLQPSASAQCRNHELIRLAVEPVQTALRHGLVPLVFGDVAFDEVLEMTIISTEVIFDFLAPVLRPSRILLAGVVDGVFTADPLRDASARPIPEITPETLPQIETLLRGSHGYDVTGGMLDKVKVMTARVERAPTLRIHLLSAMREGLILQALTDPEFRTGTVIHT